MIKRIHEFWQSFQGCLSYIDSDNNSKEIEIIVKSEKENISAILKGSELIITDNNNILLIKE